MWAKRLLPSSLGRFVKKPVDDSDASKAPEPAAQPAAAERARSSTPKRRGHDASPSSARKTQGDAEDGRRLAPTCPRAFKMITFRTPCGCESCDPFRELAERRAALPTFGRSPESPRALPTFGRSPSSSSLPRSASARSLSPRRPRPDEEVVACDWSSLHSLVGQLAVVQCQVLRKLRDDQEEQLLLSAMQTPSTAASSPSSSGYQAKKDDASPVAAVSKKEPQAEPKSASPASPRGFRPAARSASVKPVEASSEGKKKNVRPRSAAPSRESPAAQVPKAKAKAKSKSKAKTKAKAESPEESSKVPQLQRCFEKMWTLEGQEIPLENCLKAEELLQDLHLSVANPLCHHFRLRYDFLLEQHCQERKAGVARRAPKLVQGEERYLTTVRLRVRKHPAKGDPQKEFIGRGAMMAVLLHELAHLRYMNHGAEFMLLLRDIFAEAKRRGLFDPELVNELPSCRAWENLLYQTGGNVDEASLMKLFEPDGSTCATPRSASPVRARPKEKVEVESPSGGVKEAVKVSKGQLPAPPDLSEPRPSGASSGVSTVAPSGRDSLQTTPSTAESPVPEAKETVEEALGAADSPSKEALGADSPSKEAVGAADSPSKEAVGAADSPSKVRKSRVLRPPSRPPLRA